MRWASTALALLLAFLIQSGLTLVLPQHGRLLDPFLVVVVYCGLTGGETHGMLAGAAAGWVQDIEFGGTITGLSALTKILLGFAVGATATRFLLVSALARGFVLFAATLFDALAFERLALVFEIPAAEVSAGGLVSRAAMNALLGGLAFHAIERWARGRART